MKLQTVFRLLACSFIANCTSAPVTPEKLARSQAIQIHTEDIPRFWQAFDKSKNLSEVEQVQIFDDLYFKPASQGLKDFYALRIEDTKSLVQNINQVRDYYEAMRPYTLQVEYSIPNINTHFDKFKDLYPAATDVHLYFIIGKLMTAGTISESNLLIGIELFGNDLGINEKIIPKHIKTLGSSLHKLPEVIMHEIIHTQQANGDLKTLLEQSMNEGSADFLTEVVMGTHPYEDLYKYGYKNEIKLWKRFKKKMNGTDTSEFLYNVATSRSPDLGYFIGYRIVQAYYNKALDKEKAVVDILTNKNLTSIYELSGYNPK